VTEPAQRFAAWLTQAMRDAGLDIDSQRGGGRATLADTCGVSRSTVGRWLDGQSMPSAEHFRSIAKALHVPLRDVMIGGGIMDASDFEHRPQSTGPEELVAELVERWSIPAENVPLLRASVEALAAGFAQTPEPAPAKKRRIVKRPASSSRAEQ